MNENPTILAYLIAAAAIATALGVALITARWLVPSLRMRSPRVDTPLRVATSALVSSSVEQSKETFLGTAESKVVDRDPSDVNTVRLSTHRMMSPPEVSFYNFLDRTLNREWIILIKPPLTTTFDRDGLLQQELFKMYSKGHIDFLILHRLSSEPKLGIELDDSTHDTPAGQDRDRRKDELFRLANLTLLRFRVGDRWGHEHQQIIKAALSARDPLNFASKQPQTAQREQLQML